MSNTNNTAFLEHYYEEGLAMGMTEEEAEEYAYEKFDGGMDY
jgi:pyrroline-5-carboxylate reductase|tara:strand:- start:540 stop:665 length:126 start_codon:yes stop_codon:yes gene_type:complete